MIGSDIAHYRITALLGEGGMGAVYRATDTKLNRDVAIKVLPEAFANDPDRLARFTREAQVLASLNHPNIATIHGIEEGAIVMELVEGPTLADRIAGGALVVEETVRIARQLADALKAAHEKGIVHRDLKPANVKLTPDGVVKVLDFGLAKLSEPAEQSDPALAQTIAKGQSPTMAGMILGTAGYMSPEQAAGRVVDRRADIWAFGVLLWEMLCGATLFSGETVVHMLAEVLKTPIDLAKLPATIPQPLRTLIARCLERDLRNRLQDIGEARYTLERLESGVVEHQQPAPGRIRRWPWIAAVLLSAIAGAAGWIWRPTVEQPFMELAVKLPEGVSLPALIGYGAQMAFSPDGTRLAFVGVSKGRRGLWMRNLQTSTATMVPETWGANTPFWSPDSRHVAYFANGKLMRVDLSTGAASVICPIENVFGATWDPAGSILIGSRDGPLRRVSAEGGVPSLLPSFSGNSGVGQYTPFFLPGGNRFLYSSSADHFVYLASVDGKLNRKLMRSSTPPGYTEDSDSRKGWILQVDLTALYATQFDAGKNEVVGERVKILDDVAPGPSSAASSGKLLAVRRSINTGYTLSWYRRNGEVADVVAEPGIIQDLSISADGKAAAWQESGRIWVHDLTRKVTAQFTTDAGTHPLWTNHGTALVYDTLRQGNTVAVERPVSGVIGEKILYQKEGRPQGVVSISADGRVAVIHDGSEVIVRTSDGRSIPFPGLNLTREQTISPDGDWCLASVRTGDSSEIDAYSVPAPAGGGKAMVKVRISAQGGRQPRWRKDGKEIFYIADDGQLTAVPVEMSRDFLRPGVPKTLFRTRLGRVSYDVSPDGQKFLLSQPSTDSAESWLTIIVNWPRLLKK